ncbi:unannotated protein [freshwater metagenome]|uniref:Unannotated protein n=1 Tax=freshwater metagenome TaxID=449393 RepID=A0A6J7F7Z9_9ZZZZ|nr:hypothetical protein [Actinomycetota bacterium]
MSAYVTEVDAKHALNINTWRNLSKDKVLQFLQTMPQMDPAVALKVVAQIPEITSLARGAIDDAAKAYDGALVSNEHSYAAAQQFAREGLAILREELARDNLTPEDRMRVLAQISEAIDAVFEKETENKHFIAHMHGQTLATIGMGVLTVVGVVAAAAWTGQKPSLGSLFGKS